MSYPAAIVARVVVLGVVWVALAGWTADYALYGVVSVAAATALSLALVPPPRTGAQGWPRRAVGSVRLAGWFLRQAAVGGADVALRAVRRTPDIAPEVKPAPFRLPPGPARETAMLLMNLMPGTMVQQTVTSSGETADQPGTVAAGVELHTLSEALGPVDQWEELQRRVAVAYGVSPTSGPAGR